MIAIKSYNGKKYSWILKQVTNHRPHRLQYILTFVELATELMVGTALHDLGDMLRLFVDRHGPDDSPLGRVGQNLHLDWTSLGNLTIEFLQVCRVLEYRKGEGGRLDNHGRIFPPFSGTARPQ